MVMNITNELSCCLRARVPLIVMVTVEEERALALLVQVQEERTSPGDVVTWDLATRFTSRLGRTTRDAAEPGAALDVIREEVDQAPERRDLYVLRDFHEFWGKDPRIRRRLRTLAHRLATAGATVVVTTPHRDVPEELRNEAEILDLPLPGVIELSRYLDAVIGAIAGVRADLTAHGRTRLAQAALGLTEVQARRAFGKAIVSNDVLDERAISVVLAEKKAVVRASGALEFHTAAETQEDIGGLDVMKNWLILRERAFSNEARRFGLPAPKGIALIGIPGTGKSLTARAVAGMWRLPLLRLDVGAVFGSLVGESEQRIGQALRLAGTIAPCVLWIDELDKSLGGGDLDGGTSQRVLATVLTWMQEKTDPVFVVATANDVGRLPPELLRRGRFDEIFFLDLPSEAERNEILAVHLRKRRRDPGAFDLTALARAAAGFTGAELEQALVDALHLAFADGRDVTTADLMGSIKIMVPLSRSQRDVVDDLRRWPAEGRAQSASYPDSL
jgi:AAA+ superfamily predicted ATPase